MKLPEFIAFTEGEIAFLTEARSNNPSAEKLAEIDMELYYANKRLGVFKKFISKMYLESLTSGGTH